MGIGADILTGLRRATLRRRLSRRLDRHRATGDPQAVLAAPARAVAERLAAAVGDRADLPSLRALARFHAACGEERGPDDGRADRLRARELADRMRSVDPDAVPESVIAPSGRSEALEPPGDDPALALLADALRSGDGAPAMEAARLLRQELRSRPDDPERGITLALLGGALLIASATGTPGADVDETVDVLRAATAALEDDPDGASAVGQLGWALALRYLDRGSASDRDEAVEALRESSVLVAGDPAQMVVTLTLLGGLLLERFAADGRPSDEAEALDVLRDATARTAADPAGVGEFAGLAVPAHLRPSPGKAPALLGSALYERFVSGRGPADLDEAIDALRTALSFDGTTWHGGAPQPGSGASSAIGGDSRLHTLLNLGSALISRYDRDGTPGDADEGIALLDEAARSRPSGDPDRALTYGRLGIVLTRALGHRDAAADLSRGIEALREAVAATPDTDAGRADRLADLGQALLDRFVVSGAYDPDETIETLRAAVAATGEGHPDRSRRLTSLGTGLWTRFQRVGGLADLDEAIGLGRRAVAAAAPGSFDERASRLMLAAWLHGRFRRTRQDVDLEEALEAIRRAVALTGDDPETRGVALATLGTLLQSRFQHRGAPEDLRAAVEALRAGVELRPADHPRGRALARANLANALRLAFDQGGPLSDIDEAVDALRGKLPFDADVVNLAATTCALGEALASRYRRTREEATRREALGCLLEVADMVAAPAHLRLQAAKAWTALAADVEDWPDAVAGASRATELLALLAWRGLPRRDQERLLFDHEGLAGDAAAYALLAGDSGRALEMLEHGRGVLLGQALDTRTDIGGLRSRRPDLARRLEEIRDALDSGGSGDLVPGQPPADARPATGADYERRLLLAREWDGLVERIRRLDGSLAGFLRRPDASRLRGVAAEGPVVVLNVCDLRSDALVLTAGRLLTVPLPDVTPQRVAEYVVDFYLALQDPAKPSARAALEDTLAWLWDAAAEPVLDTLGLSAVPPDGTPPRLWWVPTGLLTLLPLHAAGRADDGVLDRVVSSYAPTVGALAHARNAVRAPGATRVTVVAMPGDGLPNARRESEDIARLFPGVRQLVDGGATRDAVLRALPASHVVHFACHGAQDLEDPSRGHLRLHDGILDVLELSRLRLGTAELAYLSACQSATGGIALADEAVHLASAFQLAGYRQVIGTLWPIEDAAAADIARDVYTRLRREDGAPATDEAAAALHTAVRRARAAHPREPHLWASHIHLGP
ncbi:MULTISPECIES: CHAT domain-containing protein [Streptomyces]|uniref:CHAT domain-containing protein n=2 Tax=Streptomyces TaxID=1883 RepID=A0A2U9P9V0_STRAS|nr:CHAT domain-containing protein [Streptomyces actuosus]AWT46486.1 hypothetical protein DMT42_32120 [Streptomyces actuosus]MBM4823191.1 CHAT domain-containing protein [Streptomyces actuosus]